MSDAPAKWVTFDCYGTLIDWEHGIAQTLVRLWPEADAPRLLSRYNEIEPQVQRNSGEPYRDVLTDVLRRLADDEALPLAAQEADALARSLPSWPPFPEVPDSLREIRKRGWRTCVLSNTDPELLGSSIDLIGVPFDARITVAEAGSYKPARGHWERFFELTGAERSAHVHVGASIFHDIEPARGLGLRSVWINRSGVHSEVSPTSELPDLSALPDVLDKLNTAPG